MNICTCITCLNKLEREMDDRRERERERRRRQKQSHSCAALSGTFGRPMTPVQIAIRSRQRCDTHLIFERGAWAFARRPHRPKNLSLPVKGGPSGGREGGFNENHLTTQCADSGTRRQCCRINHLQKDAVQGMVMVALLLLLSAHFVGGGVT